MAVDALTPLPPPPPQCESKRARHAQTTLNDVAHMRM
jgi:hypothetical protein